MLIRFPGLSAVPGVRHAVTTRALGDLKSAEARARLAAALGVPEAALVRGRQVHGTAIGEDILVTAEPGRVLVSMCADCAAVALVADDGRAVAVAHAGWRGAVAGAASRAVRALAEGFDVPAARLRAAIGPCIGACCFEVGEEVLDAARGRPGGVAAIRGSRHLDLAALVRADLVAAGVHPEAIEAAPECTRCRQDLFFSYRGTGTAERFGMVVGRL